MVKRRGRYHGWHHVVRADQGTAAGWEVRRIRYGLQAVLFKDSYVRADADAGEQFDPGYEGLVDAFVRWESSEQLSLSVGRIGALYALRPVRGRSRTGAITSFHP